jgi:hypothetical protein
MTTYVLRLSATCHGDTALERAHTPGSRARSRWNAEVTGLSRVANIGDKYCRILLQIDYNFLAL